MTMTREEILAGVERLKPWFHCIELGHAVRTKHETYGSEPTDHPQGTWQTIRRHLPEDLQGKSLLDVGCNAGFYAVEAKRRGAARVLGVDAQRHQIRQARFVRRALGLDIEFEKLSVYDLDPRSTGQFDITLALGLIYHCKHLVLALERLFHITRELLILETAIFPPERSPGSFAYPVGGLESMLHPLAYVENPPDVKEAIYNWFLPSPASLDALLRNVGFDEVETHKGVGRDRAVLVCRKREPYPDSRVLSHLSASISLEDAPAHAVPPAAESAFRLRVENTGFARWLAEGEPQTGRGAVHLAAHLLSADEQDLFWYYAGALLPRDLAPGESASVELRLRAPDAPGQYLLEFDMVSEHLAWFEDLGSPTLKHEITVSSER
jgi:tRNA (mo5U34)-methyltransferase